MRTIQPCMIFIASMNSKNLYKSADAYCISYSSEVTCIFFQDEQDFSRIIAQECSFFQSIMSKLFYMKTLVHPMGTCCSACINFN